MLTIGAFHSANCTRYFAHFTPSLCKLHCTLSVLPLKELADTCFVCNVAGIPRSQSLPAPTLLSYDLHLEPLRHPATTATPSPAALLLGIRKTAVADRPASERSFQTEMRLECDLRWRPAPSQASQILHRPVDGAAAARVEGYRVSWELLPYEGSRAQLSLISLDRELLGGADFAHSAIGNGFGKLDGWEAAAGGERGLAGLGGAAADAQTTYTNVEVDEAEDPAVARVLRLPKHAAVLPLSVRAAARRERDSLPALPHGGLQTAQSGGGSSRQSSWRHRRGVGAGFRSPSRYKGPAGLLVESNRSSEQSPQTYSQQYSEDVQQSSHKRPRSQLAGTGRAQLPLQESAPVHSLPLSSSPSPDAEHGPAEAEEGVQYVQTVGLRTTSASIGGLEPFAWYRVRVEAVSRGGAERSSPAVLYLYTGASENLLAEARALLQRAQLARETQAKSTPRAHHRHTTAAPSAHNRRRGSGSGSGRGSSSGRAPIAPSAFTSGGASSPLHMYSNQLHHHTIVSMPVLLSCLTALLLLLSAT